MRILGFFIVFFSMNFIGEATAQNSTRLYKPTLSITPDLVPDYRLKSGDIAEFKGNICLFKRHPVYVDKTKCHKIIDEAQFSDYEIKFFFPDTNSDITEKVNLSQDDQGIDYHFTSLEVRANDLNRFTVVVQKKGTQPEGFLNTQAKFERHIQILSERIRELDGKTEDIDALNKLKKLQGTLKKVKDKVLNKVIEEPKVWARLDYPVQVENNIMAPVEYFSIVSGMKLWMQIPLGVAIEGETTKIRAKVTNLRQKDDLLDEYESKEYFKRKWRYKADLFWEGSVVKSSEEKLLSSGDMFELEYQTGPLSPSDINKFDLKVVRSKEVPKHAASYQMLQNQGWGDIGYKLDVQTDTKAPIWSNQSIISEIQYFQTYPKFSIQAWDKFGRIKKGSIKVNTNAELVTGEIVSLDLLPLLNIEAKAEMFDQEFHGIEPGSHVYEISGSINPLDEGFYNLSAELSDFSGKFAQPHPLTRTFRIDRTAPKVTISQADNQRVNDANFALPISIRDASPVIITVVHNGHQVEEVHDKVSYVTVSLTEGQNSIEVRVVDAAGNFAEDFKLNNIVLDTTPPELTNIVPGKGDVIKKLKFKVKSEFSEPVASISIDKDEVYSGAGVESFETLLTKQHEGEHSFELEFFDLAGNSTKAIIDFKINLKIFQANLISVGPSDTGLQLNGAAGAARPNLDIEISTGFFEKIIITSGDDGSFSAIVPPFNTLELYAYDKTVEREETLIIENDIDTSLTGVVKSSGDVPLPGVKVTIVNTNQSAITDASGVFKIQNPATGIQKVYFDGSTSGLNSNELKFPQTNITVNIGSFQKNVLDHIVYLTPLRMSNAVEVKEGEAVSVSNEDLPNVGLYVPANSANFPGGGKTGHISIEKISSDRTSLPPPHFAVPDFVYALEPSGVKFDEPVQLTLPNENNLPPDLDMVILSKNSETGYWEVDGVARVDSGGQTITTLEGQGITHFSDVFAVPIFPKPKNFDLSTIGADSFRNSLSRSITLPKYKALNRDFGVSLYYNSQYAHPSPVITNVLKVPETTVNRDVVTGEMVIHPGYDPEGIDANYAIEVYEKLSPKYFEAKLKVADIETKWFRFGGTPKGDSVVSFSPDLSSLPTGIYPFTASYKLQFEHLLIQTQNVSIRESYRKCVWEWYQYVCKKKYHTTHLEPTQKQEVTLKAVFPDDLVGKIAVVNKKDSSIGTGWSLSGLQKIVDPMSNQLVVDEGNSKLSIFNAEITAEVIKEGSFEALSFNNEKLFISLTNGELYSAENENYDMTLLKSEGATPGMKHYNVSRFFTIPDPSCGGPRCPRIPKSECKQMKSSFTLIDSVRSVVPFVGSAIYFVDGKNSLKKLDSNGTSNVVSGGYEAVQNSSELSQDSRKILGATFCGLYEDLFSECQDTTLKTSETCDENFPEDGFGKRPLVGMQDGHFSAALFNKPKSISPGIGGSFIVADYGNNAVRNVNVTTQNVETVLGNGGNFTHINDGDNADQVSFSKPVDAKYDSFGNLYVLNEEGILIQIDQSNKIKVIIDRNSNGIRSSYKVKETYLRNPFGFVFGNSDDEIYVSDTDNHRVLKIDLKKNLTTTVVGSGLCQIAQGYEATINALEANLCFPKALTFTNTGNLLVNDSGNKVLRKINFNVELGNQVTFTAATKNGEYIIKTADDTFERISLNGAITKFSPVGLQVKSISPHGLETNFQYEGELLTNIVDPNGDVTVLSYDNGLLSQITDPVGRTTAFSHGPFNFLTDVHFSDSTNKIFNYNPSGFLLSETNQNGNTTQYIYSNANKLSQILLPDGSDRKFNFGLEGSVLSEGKDETEQFLSSILEGEFFDEHIDGNLNAITIVHDLERNEKSFIDGRGRKTVILYEMEKVKRVTKPDGSYTEFTYNSFGDITEQYDSLRGAKELFEYNEGGALTKHTNFEGKTKTFTYNEFGQKVREVSFTGEESNWVYNELGLISKKYLNDPQTAKIFNYDNYGNLAEEIFPDGKKVTYVRDNAGNVIEKFTDSSSKTIFSHDDFNRLTSVSEGVGSGDPVGSITTYEYSATGQLVKIIDAFGNASKFIYDSLDRLSIKTNPYGRSHIYGYDGNGNITFEKDFAGNEKTNFYDEYNRKVKTILPDDVYHLTYTDEGNLDTISNDTSFIDYDYSYRNGEYVISSERSISNGFKEAVVEFDVGNDGLVNRIDSTWGSLNFNYDLNNRIKSLTDFIGDTYSFDYVENGLLSRISNSKAFVTKMAYNPNRQIASIENTKGANPLDYFYYEYNNLGMVSSVTTNSGTKNFNYDNSLQLIFSEGGGSEQESFDYDDVGNRVNSSQGSLKYDTKKGRLIEDWKFFYTFDLNGNLSSKLEKVINGKVINYSHNSLNQLLSMTESRNNVLLREVFFQYDAIGRRVEKRVQNYQDPSKNYVERYGYIGNDIVSIMDGSNTSLATVTHSNVRSDEALSLHVSEAGIGKIADTAGSYYYMRDAMGSIIDLYRDDGTLVQHYSYGAFGTIKDVVDAQGGSLLESEKVKTFYAFANSLYDAELDMYFNRARNYDPKIGRFIQPDPHNGYLKLPRTVVNKYIYSLNNPTNFRDPSGANMFEDFFNGLANTGAAAINGLGKAVEGFFQGLGDLLTSEEIRVALIVVAAFYTGGLAGGLVGGGMMGAAVGAVVGGITGAAVGGIHAQISGDDPGMWMKKGFQIGAAVGSISGYTQGFGMFESAGDPTLLASNATQGGGLSAECYSAAATYYNVVAGGEYLNSLSTILMGPWRKGASWGGKLMKYSGEHFLRPRMEKACLV